MKQASNKSDDYHNRLRDERRMREVLVDLLRDHSIEVNDLINGLDDAGFEIVRKAR